MIPCWGLNGDDEHAGHDDACLNVRASTSSLVVKRMSRCSPAAQMTPPTSHQEFRKAHAVAALYEGVVAGQIRHSPEGYSGEGYAADSSKLVKAPKLRQCCTRSPDLCCEHMGSTVEEDMTSNQQLCKSHDTLLRPIMYVGASLSSLKLPCYLENVYSK